MFCFLHKISFGNCVLLVLQKYLILMQFLWFDLFFLSFHLDTFLLLISSSCDPVLHLSLFNYTLLVQEHLSSLNSEPVQLDFCSPLQARCYLSVSVRIFAVLLSEI